MASYPSIALVLLLHALQFAVNAWQPLPPQIKRQLACAYEARTSKPIYQGRYPPQCLLAVEDEAHEFTMTVSYEGRDSQFRIRSNETILTAMERSAVHDQLAIPALPSDCRRGNCMTCSGRHTLSSKKSALQRGEDGLSPTISRAVRKKGYVLTCSSTVTGEGVQLELGTNHDAWNDIYRGWIEDEEAKYIGRSAMATTIRLSDERNPKRWADETEAVLAKSGDQNSK